jgi:hypothetical protein
MFGRGLESSLCLISLFYFPFTMVEVSIDFIYCSNVLKICHDVDIDLREFKSLVGETNAKIQ